MLRGEKLARVDLVRGFVINLFFTLYAVKFYEVLAF